MDNQIVKFGSFASGTPITVYYNPVDSFLSTQVRFENYNQNTEKYTVSVFANRDFIASPILPDSIVSCGSFSSDGISVDPNNNSRLFLTFKASAFPTGITDAEKGKYLGYNIQNFYIFDKTKNFIKTEVASYGIQSEAAMYGYHDEVYNVESVYSISTTTIHLSNVKGEVNQLVASTGYVLAVNPECVTPDITQDFNNLLGHQFPVPLGGGIVDSGIVKATLLNRKALTNRRKFKGRLEFRLIG